METDIFSDKKIPSSQAKIIDITPFLPGVGHEDQKARHMEAICDACARLHVLGEDWDTLLLLKELAATIEQGGSAKKAVLR